MEYRKYAKDLKGNWVRVVLTETEQGEIREKLRQENIELYNKCLADAHDILKDRVVFVWDTTLTATALFNALKTQYYSALLARLDEKCDELKKVSPERQEPEPEEMEGKMASPKPLKSYHDSVFGHEGSA